MARLLPVAEARGYRREEFVEGQRESPLVEDELSVQADFSRLNPFPPVDLFDL
jgi:hypothetical protein